MGESKIAGEVQARREPWVWFAGLILWIGFLVFCRYYHSTPIDDAYISFRHLDQWLRGGGLGFNPGEPVEGYSNLLWILVLAPFARIGLDLPSLAVTFELGLAALCLIIVALGARRMIPHGSFWVLAAPLLLGVNSIFLFWIGKGMEANLYAVLLIAFAVAVIAFRERESIGLREGLWVGLLGAATALTRPEGVAPPAAVLAALILFDRGRRKAWILAMAVVCVAFFGQVGFRLAYYGKPLPNTYYAKKVPAMGVAVDRGIDYISEFASGDRSYWFYERDALSRIPFWILWGVVAAFAVRQWRRLWPLAIEIGVIVGLVAFVGGDWMPGYRFLMPVIPLGCLLVGIGLAELAGGRRAPRWRNLLAVGLAAVLLTVEVAGTYRLMRTHEWKRWQHQIENYDAMAGWLRANAPAGSLVALSDIGIISYYNPDKKFLDVLGLTDPHIAALDGYHYEKTDVEYVLIQKPDYVLAMRYYYADKEVNRHKTPFDKRFKDHARSAGDYRFLKTVDGWREGMKGECVVFFDIFARTDDVPSSTTAM